MAAFNLSIPACSRRPASIFSPYLIALAFATTLLGACSSLPEEVQRPTSYALTDTSTTSLARDIQPLTDAHPGLSGFHVMSDGADAFANRVRFINLAEKSIDAQYYIWHLDLTGSAMYNELMAAADRGVRVRILLDDLDTAGKDTTLQLIDAHPNIELRVYNPFANRDMRAMGFITDTARVDHRMHTKTLTVDNQLSIFGGRNVGDEYFSADKNVGFGDMDALAIGPIAREISSQFDLFWNSEWVYPISAFAEGELISETDVAALRNRSDARMEEAKSSKYAEVLAELDSREYTQFSEYELSWSEWSLSYDLPSNVVEKGLTAEANLAPNLKNHMTSTSQELDIISPYFVPGEEFTKLLTDRVAAGIKVRILTNSLQSNDVSLVHAGYMRYREDLIAGGVEMYEYKATRNKELEEELGRNKIDAKDKKLHAKFFGFDRTHLFIGSFNLDPRSAVLNTELGAYFKSPAHASHLSEVFDEEIMLIAYRVQLDDDGELEWFTITEDGEEIRVDHEPDTSFWKRFNTRILSPIVPESQL
jgi:putative cardiolipin synthase